MQLEPSLDIYIDFKGWRWKAPFACMRCGIEVDPLQWAYSRSCGSCDVGKSHTARLHAFDARLFAGPHELIDRDDQFFLAEDRFLDPAEREKFPVLDPPQQPFPPIFEPLPVAGPFVPSPFPLPDQQGER